MIKIIVYSLFLTPLLLLLPLLKPHKEVFNEKLTGEDKPLVDSMGKFTIPNDIDEKDYRIKKVVIDAGHGGNDSGCSSKKGLEKKNTLAMALKLGQKIKDAYPSIDVIYTRESDEFIELHRRAQIANKAKADLFISIHCNSTDESNGVIGTETYVLGMHKKGDNLSVARRENSSILLESDYKEQYEGFDPNSNEAYIIFSLFQNAYLDKSILLAKYVEESFRSNASRKSLGVKQAGFLVLKETAMPSILIETGFLNNPHEGEFISGSSGQATISNAIFSAFQKYKKAVETHSTDTPTDAPTASHGEDATEKTGATKNSVASEKVVFKIQLATSTKTLAELPRLKNIENLEVVKNGTVFKYYKIGFNNYEGAAQSLKRLQGIGFPDAFIVAYKNGKRVNVEEVRKS